MGRVRIHYPQMEEVVLAQKTPITLGSLAVGETVTLNVGGAPREWIVVHRGKPSSIYSDTFNGGTILMMKDIYEDRRWHSANVNDYANSTIHTYLNSTFLAKLDPAVQAAVKQVKIPYRPGSGTSAAISSGENGLAAKVWLASGYEVGWTSSDGSYLRAEGAKLDYFLSGATSGANGKRVGRMSGSAFHWWSRSPRADGNSYVYRVTESGEIGQNPCGSSGGIRPCLVLPDSYVPNECATLTDLQGNPLSILAEQISGGARMVTGSYVGTESYPRTIQLGFKPLFLVIIGALHGTGYQGAALIMDGASAGFSGYNNSFVNGSGIAQIIDGGFRLSQSTGNLSGQTYSYIALG